MIGLIEGVGLPMELALLNSIPSLPYPLIKLTTILALQRTKEAYMQWLQNAGRVRGEADMMSIPFKTKIKKIPRLNGTHAHQGRGCGARH